MKKRAAKTTNKDKLEYVHQIALRPKSNECTIWPFPICREGYGILRFGKLVHRYVCETAHGPPPTKEHQASHGCGVRRCVNPHHLSWKTAKDNQADRLVHGTTFRGERSQNAKLTDVEASAIIQQRGRKTRRELADLYGVSPSTITKIWAGQRYASVRRLTMEDLIRLHVD